MNSHLNYLEESTNTVKSKNKLSATILISTYLAIWVISLASFWLFSKGDALGHTLIFLYIILPVTTLILSFIIGKNNFWGKFKWLSPIAFGLMYMLADYTTCIAFNMLAFGKLNLPQFGMIPAGAAISFLGLAMGHGIHYLLSRKK